MYGTWKAPMGLLLSGSIPPKETETSEVAATIRRPDPPPPDRLEFLDGLRGIASLYVVLYHGAMYSERMPAVLEHGRGAVDVFFVLSGFVPRGLILLHDARLIVYHKGVTQLAISSEDRIGGPAPWTTSLVSAARIPAAPSMASGGPET
jgi:acyltransferase-like protein